MAGLVIPIQLEGGGGPAAGTRHTNTRKGTEAALRKPLRKKNSRQKLRTFNIEIQLEPGAGAGGGRGRSEAGAGPRTVPVSAEAVARKNGISSKGSSVVSLPSSKLLRRTSSKDLRGAVVRRQSSKDLRQGLLRRQSSRDVVAGGPKPVPVPVDPRLELGERVTIRRDSVNGLRILTRDSEAEAEADTLQRLSDIAISATAEFSRFQEAALRTHNVYRARHGVPALTLDTELCRRAAEYADYLAQSDTFEHSGDEDNGENLYWSWSSDTSWQLEGAEPVTSWYDECAAPAYDYAREPRDTESGHFTQLVWSSSRQLGVGVTRSERTGRFYVVMKYFPPGNILGRYTQHVPPPGPAHPA